MEEKPKPKYTIKQMNDKAKELGMSYGHYSTLFAQGKVDPPDERQILRPTGNPLA